MAAWLIIGALSMFAGCGDEEPTGCCYESAYTYEWRVWNRTGDSLEVLVKFSGSDLVRGAVLGDQDTQILLRATYGYGGPPSGNEVACVSVYTMDAVLRFQQAPVPVERWGRQDIGNAETQMTLAIDVQDLAQSPVDDQCVLRAGSQITLGEVGPNSAFHAPVAGVGR